jgi:hypothetical protein
MLLKYFDSFTGLWLDIATPPYTTLEADSIGEWKTSVGYKKYIALLSQSATSAPTAIVLDNTLGGTPSFSYTSTGNYLLTLGSAFDSNKTYVIIGNSDVAQVICSAVNINNNDIQLRTFNLSGTYLNDIFNNTTIEIRVYN